MMRLVNQKREKMFRPLFVSTVALCLILEAVLAQAAEEGTPIVAGYKQGFFIKSADERFKMSLRQRVQMRFVHEEIEVGDNENAFSIPRARLAIEGHAFSKDLSYRFQMDLGKGNVALKDFYVDHALMPGQLHIRAGQWKRPFSRQQITPSGMQEFVDRAITDKAFGAGRDIGVAIHNKYEKSPDIEYAVGVFNGTGDKPWFKWDEDNPSKSKFNNVPDHVEPAVVGRLGYNYGGIKGYSEADLEGGDFRFALAASGALFLDTDDDDDSRRVAQCDFIVKSNGLSFSGASYANYTEGSMDKLGFNVQTGYVIEKKYQPVARYTYVAPEVEGNDQHELAVGLSTYFYGHNVKWQTELAALENEVTADESTRDYRFQTQLQLAF